MADLGNLYFDVLLRDKTDAEAAKIKKKVIDSLKAELDVAFDDTKLKSQVKAALGKLSGDVDVSISKVDDAKLNAILAKTYKVKIDAIVDDIADSLQKAVDKKTYKLPLSVTDITKQIQSTLSSYGFTFTANPRVMVGNIQATLDGSHGGKPYSIKITADTDKLAKDIEARLSSTLSVAAEIKKDVLRRSINDALKSAPFQIDIVVDKASARKAVQDALSRVATWNGKYTADDLRAARGESARMVASARAAEAKAKAQLALARANSVAARSADAHARVSMRLNSAMRSNINISGQLKDSFASLYSIYTLQSFLRNVIQIGGELEKQQLAMGAILHNTSQAAEISGQLKSLAVRSPFGVLDLNSFAKQLTAYSIPYNELYDTMKRLADISAGVGVDMGRIVLAYGQIRAAKFLKGTELRQLTEANIPMVDKLAERFSKLEGRIISASEVMDMISKKKVSFEDVKAVLWEMTSEGGAFYNMQETLAESVSAKWKNLGDAIDIVYGDIASSTGGILKWTAELLTELVKHWDEFSVAIGSTVTALAVLRVATAINNIVIGKNANAAIKATLAEKKRAAQALKTASIYRKLTAEEQAQLASKKRLTTAELEQLATEGKLSKETVMRMWALKQLTPLQMAHLSAILGISSAEMRGIRTMDAYRLRYKLLKAQIKEFFASIGSFIASPAFLLSAGLTAIMEILSHFSQKSEELEEISNSIAEKGEEGFKRLSEVSSKYPITLSLSGAEAQQAIDELDQTLKDYHPDYGSVYNMVFGGDDVKSAAEQYSLLSTEIQKLAESYKLLAQYKNVANIVGDETDGVFDESLKDNIEDYEDYVKSVSKASLGLRKHYSEVSTAIDRAARADAGFAEAIKDKNSIQDKVDLLEEYRDAWNEFCVAINENNSLSFGRAINNYLSERANLKASWVNEILPDVNTFADTMMAYFTGEGWDFSQLSSEQTNLVKMLVNFYVSTAKNVSDETKKKVSDEILLKMNITPAVDVVDDSLKDRIDGWKKELNELTDGEFEVEIKAASNVNDAVDAIKKAYKAAKEEAETLKPILLKAGLSFKDINLINAMSKNADGTYNVQVNGKWINGLSETAVQAMNDLYKLQEVISAAEKGSNALGFSLEDNKKKGSGKGQSDKELEKIKHQYDTLKKAYSTYKELKETYGKEKAIEMMKGEDVYSALFATKDFDIEDFVGNAKRLAGSYKLTTEARKDFHQTIMEDVFRSGVDNDKKAMQQATKDLEEYISRTTKQWSLYKEIFEATGDVELANAAFNDVMIWDNAAVSLRDRLSEAISQRGLSIDVSSIDWSMDETQAKALFAENSDLLKLYKEIQTIIRENGSEHLKANANAIKSTMTVEQKVEAIRNKMQELINQHGGDANNPAIVNILKQMQIEVDKLETELFSLSDIYDQIFGNIDFKNYGTLNKIREIAKDLIESAEQIKDAGGKDKIRISYGTGADRREFKLTRAEFEKLKKRVDEFYKIKKEKNPIRNLVDQMKEFRKTMSDPNMDMEQKAENWNKFADSVSAAANELSGYFAIMQKSLSLNGNDEMSNIFGIISSMTASVGSVFEAYSTGGYSAAMAKAAEQANKEAEGLSSSHDKDMSKRQVESQGRYQQLQNTYDAIERMLEHFLGNGADILLPAFEEDKERISEIQQKIAEVRDGKLVWADLDQLADLEAELDKLQKRTNAYQEGGVYGYQRELMKEQLKELEYQKRKEDNKKTKDQKAQADYDAQIAEIKSKIKSHAEEIASTLYGIDLKEWASQLGDALFDAWKRGEDGAEAFKKKSADILGSVMNNMLKLGVLEPAMKNLQTMLFGEDGQSGLLGRGYKPSDSDLEAIADYLMGVSSKTDDYYDMLNRLNDYMEAKFGVSMKESSEANGMTKGIQGVTEQTADLLASYINAIRADVSLKREYARRLVEDLFPAFNIVAQAQLQQLIMIQVNTARNAELVGEIRDIINANNNPGKGFKIA